MAAEWECTRWGCAEPHNSTRPNPKRLRGYASLSVNQSGVGR